MNSNMTVTLPRVTQKLTLCYERNRRNTQGLCNVLNFKVLLA